MGVIASMGFPGGAVVKNLSANARGTRSHGFNSWVRKIPWSRKWQPTPVYLPIKFNGQRSMVGYSSWYCKELDTTEHIHTHTHSSTKHEDNLGGYCDVNRA